MNTPLSAGQLPASQGLPAPVCRNEVRHTFTQSASVDEFNNAVGGVIGALFMAVVVAVVAAMLAIGGVL